MLLTDAFAPPGPTELAALERRVQRQLEKPDEPLLKLLGHGEVTLAFAWPAEAPRWACKRLPPSPDRGALRAYAAHVERYIAALRVAGVAVLPTSCHIVDSYPGTGVIFLCQPIVEARRLGPAILRSRAPDAEDPFLNAVLSTVIGVVSPRLAVDSQLSNWADIDGVPHQIDVSTPFTCDALGRPELDSRIVVAPFPWPLRGPLRRWVVPPVLKRYHDPRQSMIDFVANLIKERLEGWIGPAVAVANRLLPSPISVAEAQAYYREDAQLWETTWRAKTISRATTRLMGKTYQFLLPPRTAR
ncbi:DUF6206 family protein [Sandaracinobacteroides saxicola]|uniref:Uncharacterized protein n=1 Tax=Sandaracinobacteroides saxicola TaxID=2759707 RepID=A0A7G5ILE7_9SPHN|nr:DUF6206 family protein [Sandaracinobacteroides saxicola]QMW24189.1 hypothetical protein H3309_06965 [Sandaracinobacteroides saxicola]